MSRQQPIQLPHSIGLAPTGVQGARVVPVIISFPGAVNLIQVYTDDFFLEEQDGTINGIQSVYFDNSRNFLPMFLVVNETQQALTLPAQSQGYLPLFALNGMSYTVSFMGTESGQQGNAVLKLMFYNTPTQPFIWNAYANPVGIVTEGSNTGAALTVTVNSSASVFPNRRIYIDGVDYSVSASAFTTVSTGLNINNILLSSGGGGGAIDYQIPIPSGGTFWSTHFSPPLMSAFGSAIPNGGYQSALPFVTTTAVVGTSVFQVCNVYWHLN